MRHPLPLRQIFYLMKSRILFSGMNRNLPPASSNPGECTAIVNLRNQSGTLKPVGTPTECYSTGESNRRLIYIHSCYDGEHHITLNDKGVYYEALISSENDSFISKSTRIFELNEETALSVQSIGNTLIVICPEHIYYLLYKMGEYIYLGERPELPEISFFPKLASLPSSFNIEAHDFDRSYTAPSSLPPGELTHLNQAFYDSYFFLQDAAWKEHSFIQPILVRYALTLYDGSRIFISAPVMVSQNEPLQPAKISLLLENKGSDVCFGTKEWSISANIYKLGYRIHKLNLENWKDIVRSIDIFVTPEVGLFEPDIEHEPLKYTIMNGEYSDGYKYYEITGVPVDLDMEEIRKYYRDSSLFYKFETIDDWEKIELNTEVVIQKDIRPDMLVHEETLSIDNTALLSTGAQVSYIHNKRLHIANLKKRLFPGYPLSLFNTRRIPSSPRTAQGYVCTYLKSERGESQVVWSGEIMGFDNYLSPLLSYPDSNAYKMEMVIQTDTHRYSGTFALTPAGYEDCAEYLSDTLTANTLTEEELSQSTAPLTLPTSHNDTYILPNILRVSEIENPFLFPAEMTYTISNGGITGIATITSALSEGQFGQFPLYIFTEEGVWVLQSGNKIVCYETQHQLNREPILPGTPIVPLESCVAFVTPKGLFFIQGSTIEQIFPFDESAYESHAPIIKHEVDSSIAKAANDTTDLSSFLPGSIVVYNIIEKELICCRPDLQYSLIIHLPSLYIYRNSQAYTHLYYDASHLLGQEDSGRIYNLLKEDYTDTAIAIVSRPISFNPEGYQRWRELCCRMALSAGETHLSLWGGNDAEADFTCVARATTQGAIPGRAVMRFATPAYKYFRIILSGKVSSDFHLSAIDLSGDAIVDNKLR